MLNKFMLSTGGGAGVSYKKPCCINTALKFNTIIEIIKHNHIAFNA